MVSIATMLHISDLHFVEDLTTEGRRLGRRTRTLLAKSHSFTKLRELGRTLDGLQRRERKYDLTLVTGDVTTDGSEAAFRTALEVLEKVEIRRGEPGRLMAYGLGAVRERRLLLPGNHDRYGGRRLPFQRRSVFFESVLGTPREYPYVVGYRRPSMKADPREWTLLFFVFDSTPAPGARLWWWNRIARGQLTKAECEWLERKAREIAGEKRVVGIDGGLLEFEPEKAIRIAVLHHHPVIDEGKTDTAGKTLTSMENDTFFVDQCFRAGINFVLFGHQHVGYQLKRSPPPDLSETPFGRPRAIYFLCCPSTMEYSERGSGFYWFDFYDDRVGIELYEWRSGSFAFVARGEVTL